MATKSTRRRQREPLTRERIAKAGLQLADREGVGRLTMRRLAEHLGSGTMTLYGHFRDKRDLLDAINDVAASESQLPELKGPWRQRIHQLVAHTRGIFARHPSVVEIWALQPVLGTASLRGVEAGLQVLEDAGFERGEAVMAFRLLVIYTYAFGFFGGPRSDASAREGTRAALAALPPDRHPRLREASAAFATAMASEEAFAYGLDRILDGLEASLDRKRRGGRR